MTKTFDINLFQKKILKQFVYLCIYLDHSLKI